MPLNKLNLADYLSDVFIETGTHRGDGVRRALEAGFPRVCSCEPDGAMLARMPQALRDDERVWVSHATSGAMLPHFIEDSMPKSVTFWLDAHPNGELSLDTCPLGDELRVIKNMEGLLGKVTILIDDTRLFSEEDQKRIFNIVRKMRPFVSLSYVDGAFPNDILVGQM